MIKNGSILMNFFFFFVTIVCVSKFRAKNFICKLQNFPCIWIPFNCNALGQIKLNQKPKFKLQQ